MTTNVVTKYCCVKIRDVPPASARPGHYAIKPVLTVLFRPSHPADPVARNGDRLLHCSNSLGERGGKEEFTGRKGLFGLAFGGGPGCIGRRMARERSKVSGHF